MIYNSNKLIEQIKNFKNIEFSTSQELENAFYNLTNPIWENIKNNDEMMEAEDLSIFSATTEFLLNEVIDIHLKEKETPEHLNGKLDHVLHVDDLKGKLSGDYSHNHIYYLDSEDCDYYFIGDIHSDSFILKVLLNSTGFFNNIFNKKNFKFIFLGDYVDRGQNHFRTVEILMLLKYLYPTNTYLLMGNHDIGKVEGDEVTLYLRKAEEEKDYFYYYLRDIAKLNPTFSNSLIDLYQELLNNLNVIAYPMNSKVSFMGVHGGIPRPTENLVNDDYFEYIKSHVQFTDLSKDYAEIPIRDNMIWSDPSIQHLQPVIERKRFKFYKEHFESFKKKIGFDVFVRGHQAMEDGVMSYYNDSLYTIFSTGITLKDDENTNLDTAYNFVTPKVLKYNSASGLPLEIIELTL